MTVGHSSHAASQYGCVVANSAFAYLSCATQRRITSHGQADRRAFPTPEFELPKLDLDALFAAQQTNLAAVRETQIVLTAAVQAITEVQYGYIDQARGQRQDRADEQGAAQGPDRFPKAWPALEVRRGCQGNHGSHDRRAEARPKSCLPCAAQARLSPSRKAVAA